MSQIQTKKSCVVATRTPGRTKMAGHNVTRSRLQRRPRARRVTAKTKEYRKAQRSEGSKNIYTPETTRETDGRTQIKLFIIVFVNRSNDLFIRRLVRM